MSKVRQEILIAGCRDEKESLRDLLERAGYTVRMTNDPKTIRDSVPESDLVLIGPFSDRKEGNGLCKELREFSSVPIILLGYNNDEQSVTAGLDSGADDYVVCPFRERELLSRIRAHIRRSSGLQAEPEGFGKLICRGDLLLNKKTNTAVYRGQPVDLTGTEFDLIVYLAEHPGCVISRSELLRNVWGYEPEYSDVRIVDVNIRRIRSKLGQGVIKTRHGAGYYMD